MLNKFYRTLLTVPYTLPNMDKRQYFISPFDDQHDMFETTYEELIILVKLVCNTRQ